MRDFEPMVLVAFAVIAAVPGVVIALTPTSPSGKRGAGLVGAVLAALTVSGLLFAASQFAISALYRQPDFLAIMRLAFPEDFFSGALRLVLGFAVLCSVVAPLAFALAFALGLPTWLSLVALPLAAAFTSLAVSYRDALHQESAPLTQRMTIEVTTVVAAHLIWVAYFLLMRRVVRAIRPDLSRP